MKKILVLAMMLVLSGCSMYWLRGEPNYCDKHEMSYYSADGCHMCNVESEKEDVIIDETPKVQK